MGKGTIVSHIGEGKYRVQLNLSIARITAAIAKIVADLAELQTRINDAWQNAQDTEERLSAAIAEINAAIAEINAQIQNLADELRTARELVQQRTDELRVAQESLDQLEAWDAEDDESVTDEQIRIASEWRDEKQALLDAANDQLAAATDAWNSRDTHVQVQDAKIVEGAKIKEEWMSAKAKYQDLLIEKAALEKRKAWLESKKKDDPELDAWCADLTEDLEGEVGTIEIPGERTSESDPIIIRPGYQERAVYQARDRDQALIDAKKEALRQSTLAAERVDAASSAYEIESSRNSEMHARMDVLYGQCPFTAAEIIAMDAESRAELPDAAAEIVYLDGQINASDELLPVLEVRRATMEAALAAAQAAFDAAAQALSAARADDTEPRMADGILQAIPAAPGPFTSFFNQALLPAWQKWRPMYRVGTITELSGDRCTVALDATVSSQQGMDVNREEVLQNVPIEYMECNGGAFDVGDRVVVEFIYQDQSRPKVIGFESHPRACTKSGFLFDIRARLLGGPNESPKRFGKVPFTPTPEQPTQPDSSYAPFGYWPATEQPWEWVRLARKGDSWKAEHRVTVSDGPAYGNRCFHAWDGPKSLGCLSWQQKSCFGGEWMVRSATWAGPVQYPWETPIPRTSDYMIEKNLVSSGFAHGDIAYKGKILLRTQMLSSGLAGVRGMRVVAACIVRVPLPLPPGAPPGTEPETELRVRAITWHYAPHVTTYGMVEPNAAPAAASRKPINWRTTTMYVRPQNQAFVCWEAPVDAANESERRSRTLKVASFQPPENCWHTNPSDSDAFDFNYIDSSEYVRPDTPLGQFSKSGTKATMLMVAGQFWTHNVLNGAQIYQDFGFGAGVIGRMTWPAAADAAPAISWETQVGTQNSQSESVNGQWYSDEKGWWIENGSIWTSAGLTNFSATVPVAVDYDGENEILLNYSLNSASQHQFTLNLNIDGDDSAWLVESNTSTATYAATNGKVNIVVTDEGNTRKNLGSWNGNGSSTLVLIHHVDLVAGEVYWTQYKGGRAEQFIEFEGYKFFSTRGVEIRHNSAQVSADSITELGGYGGFNPFADQVDNYVDWEASAPSASSASTVPGFLDPTRGHLEAYHYGKGPAVVYARDEAGNFIGAMCWNEWAPLVNELRYRTAGGFVPNTTHHRVFSSAGTLDTTLQMEKLASMEVTFYAVGCV